MKALKEFISSLRDIEYLPALLGAIILGAAACYNQFPLVYSDTGSYFYYGLCGKVPYDRPLLYGLFLRHASMRASVWMALFAQLLIISSVLFAVTKIYLSKYNYRILYCAFLLVMVSCTALSIKSCTLIPDAFTVLPLLCVLLLAQNSLSKTLKFWFGTVLVFSIAIHLTHIVIVVLALVFYVSPKFIFFRKINFRTIFKQYGIIMFLLLFSFFLTPLINLKYDKHFFWSKTGNIFLVARFADNGILKKYLDRNCETKQLRLCEFKENIPGDFLWTDDSPLYKMGGLSEPSPEFDFIARDIVSSKWLWGELIYTSIIQSAQQLAATQIVVKEENRVFGFESAPHHAMRYVFKREMDNYLSSRQNTGQLDYTWITLRQNILVITLLLILIFLMIRKQVNFQSKLIQLLILSILYCMANAIVCGTFSIVTPRYQSRVFWLVPFTCMLIIAEAWLKTRPPFFKYLRRQ